MWLTIGTAAAKYVTRAVSEIDWASWLAPTPYQLPEDVDQGSQRSLAITHTLPPTVPADQAPPLVVFAEPTDSIIQLLNLASSVTPEFVMAMCAVGVISILTIIFFCLCTCVRCVKRRSCWPCARRNRALPPPHEHLSDMAAHYYALVQAQNPGILNMMPPDFERHNVRRR